MKPALQIVTERLVLRRWKADDAPAFAAMHAHPELTAWLGRAPGDVADALEYIRTTEDHFDSEGFGLWAIELRSDGSLVGLSGLRRVRWKDHPMTPCVDIGWRLARSMWGKGFATEASSAALQDGFNRAGLSEVFAWTAATNARSQAVMQRLGMERRDEMDFQHPHLPNTDPLGPHIVYAIER